MQRMYNHVLGHPIRRKVAGTLVLATSPFVAAYHSSKPTLSRPVQTQVEQLKEMLEGLHKESTKHVEQCLEDVTQTRQRLDSAIKTSQSAVDQAIQQSQTSLRNAQTAVDSVLDRSHTQVLDLQQQLGKLLSTPRVDCTPASSDWNELEEEDTPPVQRVMPPNPVVAMLEKLNARTEDIIGDLFKPENLDQLLKLAAEKGVLSQDEVTALGSGRRSLADLVIEHLGLEDEKRKYMELVDTMESIDRTLDSNFSHIERVDGLALIYFLMNSLDTEAQARLRAAEREYDLSTPVDRGLMNELFQYSLMAKLAYNEDVEAVQKQVHLDFDVREDEKSTIVRRFRKVVNVPEASPGQPSHFVAVVEEAPMGSDETDDSVWTPVKVIVSVRGTKSMSDVMTDLSMDCTQYDTPEGYAHTGIVASGKWVYEQNAELLREYHEKGAKVVIVGHSLGAGAAAITTMELMSNGIVESPMCYAYACPSLTDRATADKYKNNIITVVHNDDVIPRSSAFTLLLLHLILENFDFLKQVLRDLTTIKDNYKKSIMQVNIPTLDPEEKQKWIDGMESLFVHAVRNKIIEDRRTWIAARKADMDDPDYPSVVVNPITSKVCINVGGRFVNPLYVPGRAIQLQAQPTSESPATGDQPNNETHYFPKFVQNEKFTSIKIASTFVSDHKMDRYIVAIGNSFAAVDDDIAEDSLVADFIALLEKLKPGE